MKLYTEGFIDSLRDALSKTVGGLPSASPDLREHAEMLCALAGNGRLDTYLLPAVSSLLGYMEDEASLRVLRALAGHPDELVRVSALRALAYDRLDEEYASEILGRAESDPESEVRVTAAYAAGSLLRETQDPIAIRRLVDVIRMEDDARVRKACIHAIASILGRDQEERRHHSYDAEDTPYSLSVLAEARSRIE